MKLCLISSVNMDIPEGSTVRPYYISKNLARFGCEILHICTTLPKIEEENIKYSLKRYHKNKLWIVESFLSSLKYDEAYRCDLHPRWSPDGTKYSIDSVHEGFRES